MDERELRAAMQQAVAVAPPPMSDAPVLATARHALTRRRAVLASAGSAAVVALVAVGVAVLAPSQSDGGGVRVGGGPPAPLTHDQQAAALAATLDELAPAGYGTPDDMTGVDDFADRTLKNHKAMAAGKVGGTEVWNYAASTPLVKGDGVGELLATVFTSGAESTGEGCALTPVAWDATTAACEEVAVRGQKVAVADVTPTAGDGLPPAQWAGFRHEDGTVVFVMQSAEVPRSGGPALTAMPMTSAQLADLATDPRLKPR